MVIAPTNNPTPSWLTPMRLLAMFCVINLLNYLDRGAIASNGVNGRQATCTNGTCKPSFGIQGEFKLSNFEDGVLSSAFTVGLLMASLIFASLTKSVNPFRLIGVGLSVWTLATLCCGFSFNFWSIAVCRMLVGVGEASFVSLAAPCIDDVAPVSQVGSHFGWRYAFWAESVLMLPFVIFGYLVKPLQLKGFDTAESKLTLANETVTSEVLTHIGGPKLVITYDMLLAMMTFIGAAFCFSAFLFTSMYGFLALFAVGEILVFATQGPVSYVCLHSVKPSLRPLSMAISTIAIHVFGDVLSSPIVGVVQDHIHNWRTTALLLTARFFPAAGFWFIGIFLPSEDKFNGESDNVVYSSEPSNTPLHREKPQQQQQHQKLNPQNVDILGMIIEAIYAL